MGQYRINALAGKVGGGTTMSCVETRRDLRRCKRLLTRSVCIARHVADDSSACHGSDAIGHVGVASHGVCASWWAAVVDAGSEAELFEHPNGVPVEVDFVPLQAVPGRNRVGVMVVVPAVAETYQRHPPI